MCCYQERFSFTLKVFTFLATSMYSCVRCRFIIIIIIIVYSFSSFSHQRLPMVSHWSLSDSKSSQVSRILLSILANLSNAEVLFIIRFGHLTEVRGLVCISKSQGSLCVSFSWTYSGLCIYHLFVWSNFNFLHNS